MRRLLPLLLVACGDLPPSASATSRVLVLELPQPRPRMTDLLFVIDDSPGMAGFRADVVANAPNFIDVLSTIPGGLPDLHIAVTTADPGDDGAFRRTPALGDDHVISEVHPDGSREIDFVGTLPEVLTALVDVGASGSAAVQPLAAAKRALATHPSFLRDDADLAIVFIAASDDASPGELGDYASWFRSAKPDPETTVIVAGIAGTGCTYDGASASAATRLRAFLDAFPDRATFTTICQDDLSDGLTLYEELLSTPIVDPCIDAAIDPARCIATDRVAGVDLDLIPPCSDASAARPCVHFEATSQCDGARRQIEIDRRSFAPRGDVVRLECVVE